MKISMARANYSLCADQHYKPVLSNTANQKVDVIQTHSQIAYGVHAAASIRFLLSLGLGLTLI